MIFKILIVNLLLEFVFSFRYLLVLIFSFVRDIVLVGDSCEVWGFEIFVDDIFVFLFLVIINFCIFIMVFFIFRLYGLLGENEVFFR